MRILSIDPSTTSTGWCIYENKPIKYGCICPNKTLEYIDRVIYILKELNALKLKYEPEIIIIEQLAVTRNAKTAQMLAGLQVAIEVMFRQEEYLVIEARPSKWRAYCAIKGKKREELKQNAVNYIKNKYKIEVNDDTAESICIAEYGNSIKLE